MTFFDSICAVYLYFFMFVFPSDFLSFPMDIIVLFFYPLKMTNKNNLQELTKSLFCIKQLKTFRDDILEIQLDQDVSRGDYRKTCENIVAKLIRVS